LPEKDRLYGVFTNAGPGWSDDIICDIMRGRVASDAFELTRNLDKNDTLDHLIINPDRSLKRVELVGDSPADSGLSDNQFLHGYVGYMIRKRVQGTRQSNAVWNNKW
jgi:hypothetical protein